MQRPNHILPLIVLSQFAGTSLWFSGNAIHTDISKAFQLEQDAIAIVTSLVLIGFIAGTFLYAITAVADRFKPSIVFFISSLLASAANLLLLLPQHDFLILLVSRFGVGFFLAGIYPVGMKIAAEWYEKGLGKALGYLVGALVMGTAFPHLLKHSGWEYNWKDVLKFTSLVATIGGLLILLFVPRGPFHKTGSRYSFNTFRLSFRDANFRAASFGYFGHMWELYAFWAFVPILLNLYCKRNGELLSVPLWSFFILAAGAIGCVAGGYITLKHGSAKVAFNAMIVSFVCCVLSVFSFHLPPFLFLFFLLIWGFAVVADSPQFSSIVAQTAVAENRGSALTIVTCIGFSITVASIYLLNLLFAQFPESAFVLWILAPGPLFGLWKLRTLTREKTFN
jgi:MFS family permease